MPGYHLYILRCADDTLYTGIARDVASRLEEHLHGKRGAKYLRGRSPFELLYECDAGDRATAQALEYRVKRLAREEKLELIAGRRALPDVS